ncbi:MAG: ABC transporter ATP-binding protein [Clostridia bacterium]|jgi:zinc transport system ATP-binding protein|nr:ABC transporter ATP-binding protein [Clostridia bacterium]
MNVLSVKNLSVNYEHTQALSDVSLEVEEGEYLGIIGPNGGGKTTFLKAVLGLVAPSAGSIEVFGKPPGRAGTKLGYVPQSTALDKNFPLTVLQAVLTGRLIPQLSFFHRYSRTDRELAEGLLQQVGLSALENRLLGELSGGEFQKLLIARALAVQPKMLLLDEPTASVDAVSREQIYALLGELNQTMTIVLVTHDLAAVATQARKAAHLSGRLVYHGEQKDSSTLLLSQNDRRGAF